MICFLRFSRATFDRTRGIGQFSLGLKQALDALRIANGLHRRGTAELALPLRGLLGKNVALVSLHPAHFPLRRDGETLLRALVGLHFRHIDLFYFGVRIIVRAFPSSRASVSIFETSASATATLATTARPSSGWAICRPRNISVTFTLFPSWRNSRAWRVFVSKSCTSIPGRYFTSFSRMTCCFFLACRVCFAISNLYFPL